jgi:Putative peptidoglycan binding domain/L,D-transpeptidase catalytic domain
VKRECLGVSRRRTCLLSSVVFAAALLAVSPERALAADAVTLAVGPNPVAYGGRVTFSGTIAPAAAGEAVGIYAQGDGGSTPVVSATTDAAGAFSASATVSGPAAFVAQAADAAGNAVASAPVAVSVRPRAVASLRGSRRIGARLVVVGSVLPRTAGALTLSEGGRLRTVAVAPDGRFRMRLTTTRLYRYRAVVRLRPAAGFVGWQKTYRVRVALRPLEIGSSGPAVAWLEYRLYAVDHYALPGIGNVYGTATADAVLAFQKVHGLPRTGVVDRRVWQVLRTSRPPLARVRSGSHIEVDKTRQVLFEVRGGKIVSVSHVSTGATGNTPVGRWHVYSKGPGFNALGMFDSLFFLRGFAIHGYHSVPSYAASHGCVRTPFWFARGLYSRWGVGASVYVFA